MKLISFDVGIKNMAYCIFDCSQNISIEEWDVLNLMDTDLPKPICGCKTVPKSKKAISKPCTKMAKYITPSSIEPQYVCEKHAKENSEYIVPSKRTSTTFLKKQKIDTLLTIGKSHNLFLNMENSTKLKKQEILEIIDEFYKKRCFGEIVNKKSKTANDTDLIFIGKRMKELLNQIPNIKEITDVAIENQISPIANRMKTIQGMLAQYFIMNNSDSNIEFVSSSHKLRQFENKEKKDKKEEEKKEEKKDKLENTLMPFTPSTNQKKEYTKHKLDGVIYCSKILENNDILSEWKGSLLTKKKDDLADCFLQGVWYLSNKNKIIFADNLNIKLIALS